MNLRLVTSPLLALAVLTLFGCRKEEIKYYTVAKSKDRGSAMTDMATAGGMDQTQMPPGHPAVGGSGGMGGGMMAGPGTGGPTGVSEGNDLTWSVPSDWLPKSLGSMRKGSYSIKGDNGQEADLSVFVFPGAAGGLVDNINRWRGQIGLAPLDDAKANAETVSMKTDSGMPFTYVDMSGPAGDRILGAILPLGEESWFFKLKGPSALLDKQKNAFAAFLKSVKAK